MSSLLSNFLGWLDAEHVSKIKMSERVMSRFELEALCHVVLPSSPLADNNKGMLFDFQGKKTWRESVDMLAKGWEDAPLVGMFKSAASLAYESIAEKQAMTWQMDVAGDEVDVGTFLSGEPECMAVPSYRADRPRINFHVLGTYSCNVSGPAIEQWGLQVTACIQALESAGYAVAVYQSVIVTKQKQVSPDNRVCAYAVKLKDASEPLNFKELALHIANPAIVRGIHILMLRFAKDGKFKDYYPVTPCDETINGAACQRLSADIDRADGARGFWYPAAQGGLANALDSNEVTIEACRDRIQKSLRAMGFEP